MRLTDRVVFLLGAGASKDAYLPLVKDLTDLDYLNFLVKGVNESFSNWSHSVPSEAVEICKLVEDSNVSFEEILYQKFNQGDEKIYSQLLGFYESTLLLAETFSGSVPVYSDSTPFGMLLSKLNYGMGYYVLFATILSKLPDATVITFNHDLSLERGLEWKGFNYGKISTHLLPYSYKINFSFDGPTLLKLHGSFNFVYCNQCDSTIYYMDYFWTKGMVTCSNCGAVAKPWYVPPLREKDYKPFRQFWDDAADELKNATSLVIVGYSFPDYDNEARRLIYENLNTDAMVSIVDKYPHSVCEKLNALPNRNKTYWEIGFRDYLLTGLFPVATGNVEKPF